MKTILEIFDLTSTHPDQDRDVIVDLVDEQVQKCIDEGDYLGAGEWLSSKLPFVEEDQIEEIFSKAIALWASPGEFKQLPDDIDELISRFDEYGSDNLAIAFIHAILRVRLTCSVDSVPPKAGDLAFRLTKPMSVLFGGDPRHSIQVRNNAAVKLDNINNELEAAVTSFTNAHSTSAKAASVELIKKARQRKELSLVAERPILSEIEILLGPYFRTFCEGAEQQNIAAVLKIAPALLEQALSVLKTPDKWVNSTLWLLVVSRIAEHIISLVNDETRRGEEATTPSLKFACGVFKLDLSKTEREKIFSCRVLNKGEGLARRVTLDYRQPDNSVDLKIIDPKGPFEIGGESEQFVTFAVKFNEVRESFSIPITWKCFTLSGRPHTDSGVLLIQQQRVQPDWAQVLSRKPYSLNPVSKQEQLFGRDILLKRLFLHANNGNSTFVWGQKRVGKTSLLQVLNNDVLKTKDFVCASFRMGQIKGLHEGQIGYVIAQRLSEQLSGMSVPVPVEQQFGAGLGSLIPFMEKLVQLMPETKFVVIIDEFDDLNPALYTGERGKLFIKALRSLSELGTTFFFIGSERMKAIYTRHEADLNKWIDLSLDIIESREDCKSLITQPVTQAIEYQPECLDMIMDYCGRNPFYMHLLCQEVLKRCYEEERTYIGESDVDNVRKYLIQTVSSANFAHFWEDNPEIDEAEKVKQAAENCLILCCVTIIGGDYRSIDDVYEAQDKLGLFPTETLTNRGIRTVVERLINRGVLLLDRSGGKINLEIFRDWLAQHAEIELLPKWRDYCRKRISQEIGGDSPAPHVMMEELFVIPEEELLAVASSLVYCGKQKDVSELRVWLKQFDDDVRIEMAFLLIRRLAEKGFVTDGARVHALHKLQDTLTTQRREIGQGVWKVIKGRLDNLCITYVDSEMKSGATTAREFAKLVRPGKQAAPDSIAQWVATHAEQDSLILIIDDFSGTGGTISKGLKRFFDQAKIDRADSHYISEGRILCYLLYAFPEALDKLKKEYTEVKFIAANVFGDEVRALDPDAGIFSDKDHLAFAKEVLTQLGRELTPQRPLGEGDMATLICFHNTVPNNTLPIFWSNGVVREKPWRPLFPRSA